jgi:membrane protein YqaA with SNARE-associated domain
VRLPLVEVWLAILLGKLLKYGLYAWLVARFPARFARLYAHLLSDAQEGHA